MSGRLSSKAKDKEEKLNKEAAALGLTSTGTAKDVTPHFLKPLVPGNDGRLYTAPDVRRDINADIQSTQQTFPTLESSNLPPQARVLRTEAQKQGKSTHRLSTRSAADNALTEDGAGLVDSMRGVNERADDGSNAAAGAVTGGVVGGAAGLAASLMGLAIPGIGPIIAAGPIVSLLTGAGVGAVAGGLIGGLTDMGVSRADAEYYAEAVRRGGALVTVRADDARAERAAEIMRSHGAIDIERRVERWRQGGWSGYDEKAQPYTPADLAREEDLYGERDRETGLASGAPTGGPVTSGPGASIPDRDTAGSKADQGTPGTTGPRVY